MPLIQIVIVLIVIGVLLWLVNLIHDAGDYKIHPERRGGYLRGALASERVRSAKLFATHPSGFLRIPGCW
jgi:hypothetical protein